MSKLETQPQPFGSGGDTPPTDTALAWPDDAEAELRARFNQLFKDFKQFAVQLVGEGHKVSWGLTYNLEVWKKKE